MNLFQHLPYAPKLNLFTGLQMSKSIYRLAVSDCCPSSDEEGDMTESASGEYSIRHFAVHSNSYHVRNAALLVIRKYMQHSEEHAFKVCRLVEGMAGSTLEAEQMLYNMVKEETEE